MIVGLAFLVLLALLLIGVPAFASIGLVAAGLLLARRHVARRHRPGRASIISTAPR